MVIMTTQQLFAFASIAFAYSFFFMSLLFIYYLILSRRLRESPFSCRQEAARLQLDAAVFLVLLHFIYLVNLLNK